MNKQKKPSKIIDNYGYIISSWTHYSIFKEAERRYEIFYDPVSFTYKKAYVYNKHRLKCPHGDSSAIPVSGESCRFVQLLSFPGLVPLTDGQRSNLSMLFSACMLQPATLTEFTQYLAMEIHLFDQVTPLPINSSFAKDPENVDRHSEDFQTHLLLPDKAYSALLPHKRFLTISGIALYLLQKRILGL